MSDKPLLPIYAINVGKRIPKLSYLSLKSLIIVLIGLSLLGLIVLFMNLPQDIQKVVNTKQLHDLFIPDVHQHGFDNQQPPPPIDILNSHIDHIATKNIATAKATASENDARREKIRQMTRFGWENYEKFAWGQNELKPISKTGHSAGIFGANTQMGATIVDGLDTMLLMGYKDEVARGREWIEKKFNIHQDTDMSAFEITIRFIGGFLAMYTLTEDKMYLDKAAEVADALMPIFDTPTGIPKSLVNPVRKSTSNYNWASGSCSILAEIGTLSLEFEFLSEKTGKSIYAEKVKKIQKVLFETEKENGLYFNYINPNTGKWCLKHASVGALGDSFYEYLLKVWIYSGKKDQQALDMFLSAMEGIRKNMLMTSDSGLTFIGEFKSGNRIEKKMDHLACFIGGLFALTVMHTPLSNTDRDLYHSLAVNITHTCHESYRRTATKIGPEAFHFERVETDAQAIKSNERYYILRPEVVEAYFYLWRLTKDQKYRDWAWEAADAIEKHCKTENGYSGIKDVYEPIPAKDDVQQSFFFAETLKYLYLTFSTDDVLSLEKYVFNTEAHPLLISQ